MSTLALGDIPRPKIEMAATAVKSQEPYKPEVKLNDIISGQPPREFTAQVVNGLDNPSKLQTTSDPVRDEAKRTAIQTYLEKNAGMKRELLEGAAQDLAQKSIKPNDPQYINFLENTLVQFAYGRVIEGMKIDNIKKAGSAVLDELQKYIEYMKIRARLEEKFPFGIYKHKFNPQKDTLATSKHTNFDELYRTSAGRQKLMAQAAGENQESLRSYLDTKAADEQFANLPRNQQMEMLSDASRKSLDRVGLLGQQMLDRGEAVGGVLLAITNRLNEASAQRFDALVGDRRIKEGVSRISRGGGAIRLAENVDGGATYVIMGTNGQVSGITNNEAQFNPGGGRFADYHSNAEVVIGQMVGAIALTSPK